MLRSSILTSACLVLFSVLSFVVSSARAEVVLSDDGREVRLNEDGSWEFVSEDRFATTEDGKRVRLKADGSWEAVDDDNRWVQAASAAANAPARKDRIITSNIEVVLSDWRIESNRDKRKKNSTLRAQMVVELTVTSKADLPALRTGQLKVSDNRGRVYPVTKISRAVQVGNAGDGVKKIRMIVDGAPRWFGLKHFRLELLPGGLGLERGVLLTKAMADVDEVDVDALTEL